MKKLLFVFAALLGLVAMSPAKAQKKKPTETIKPVELTQDPIIKAQSFRLVGPFRGGRAAAGVGSYTEVNTFYMGATGGGVWKTTDAGNNWKNISMVILVVQLVPLQLRHRMNLSFMWAKGRTPCVAM